MIQVVPQLTPAQEAELQAFLSAAPACTGVCGEHDPRWLTILREALGHRPYALMARGSDSRITGYLPLAFVATRLFGRFLVSLPYLNRAGVVTPDPAVAAALVDQAIALARDLDAQYLELRHGAPLSHPGLPTQRDEKVRMVFDLPADPETLRKNLDQKVRNQVKKGEKSNLTIRHGGLDLLDAFYDVFAVNMRDLGTPVYSRQLFASILQRLPDAAELVAVYHENQPIAGALLVHDRGGPDRPPSTQVPSASSLRQYSTLNANMLMYFHLLTRAMERGSRQFDFGRSSRDSGTYRFKKQWGAQEQPTVWQYHVRRGGIDAVRPDSPKYRRRIALWQRLPVWLTRLVGPHLVRGIP